MGAGYHGPGWCATPSRYLVPAWLKMVLKIEVVGVGSIHYLPGLTGDRRPHMAKAPAGKNVSSSKSSGSASGSKSAPGEVARKAKTSVKGNGSHEAQAELDLLSGIEEAEEEAASESQEKAPVQASEPPSAPAPAAPTLKELGLSGKGMWKIDLNGKRINLDEKAWREELARALGRAPTKA